MGDAAGSRPGNAPTTGGAQPGAPGLEPSPPPVLALVGATGAGKSALALDVAEHVGAEIVAIDAYTVYRGMDVGTAKPSAQDRARVPHHLLDLIEPEVDAGVSWFQVVAREAVADVLARGRVPLLVGGSGLYFRATVDPLEFPPTDPQVRATVAARLGHDPVAAHARLAERDPAAAARIDPRNLRRTVRALEVIELTGRPFSDWRRAWDEHRSVYPGLRVVGVDVDRAELAQRIECRVDGMLTAGWIEECRALHHRRLGVTARQAIGYRELLDHLEGRLPLGDARDRIVTRTRRYAVRQQRWFAADPRVRWLPPSEIPEVLIACVS